MAKIPLLFVDINNFTKDQAFKATMDSFTKLSQNKNSKESACNEYRKVATNYYMELKVNIKKYLEAELHRLI